MTQLDIDNLKSAVTKSAPLCSIFDMVSLTGRQGESSRNPLPVRALTNENIVHGVTEKMEAELQADLTTLSLLQPEGQKNTFGFLLQKYGSRIGDPNGPEVQVVAYCDAARVARALSDNSTDDFLLLKGDLSGIQSYIYGNIQQKTAGGLSKVAKRLRGRSILVTLISDFLANILIQELGCSNSNLLFVGGGHFNLLIPDNHEVRDKIASFEREVTQEMQLQFDGQLQLVLATVNCTRSQLQRQSGQCFEQLNNARESKKYQPNRHNLVTHFFPPSWQTTEEAKTKADDAIIEIGERFPKKNVLIEAVSTGKNSSQGKNDTLIKLEIGGRTYQLLMAEHHEEAASILQKINGLESAQVLLMNGTRFFPDKNSALLQLKTPIAFGFRFVGKNVPLATYIHEKTGDNRIRPQTFEEIARELADGASESQAQKLPLEMLGALRLDVDDLGYIFNKGLGTGAPLSQLVTLSREMHYFFSAHFDKLARKHLLYVIYSGGDDAFVVGGWKNIITFVKELQIDFELYVGKNKNVHFSAGLFLGDPKYPVGRFAEDAGRLLNEAKDSSEEKNRIHIFNHPLRWDAFHKKIEFGSEIAKRLGDGTSGDNKKLTMAFAYKLIQLIKTSFYERNEQVDGQKQRRGAINMKRFSRNVANLRYLFARNGYSKKMAEEMTQSIEKELFNDFIRNFDFGDKADMKAVRDNLVALNFALYNIRSQKNPDTHGKHRNNDA
jgi:CRISPR-associated protein Csm1